MPAESLQSGLNRMWEVISLRKFFVSPLGDNNHSMLLENRLEVSGDPVVNHPPIVSCRNVLFVQSN